MPLSHVVTCVRRTRQSELVFRVTALGSVCAERVWCVGVRAERMWCGCEEWVVCVLRGCGVCVRSG